MNADYRCKYLKYILLSCWRAKRNDLGVINISRLVVASSENKAPRKDHLRLFQQTTERIARAPCWSSWCRLASISAGTATAILMAAAAGLPTAPVRSRHDVLLIMATSWRRFFRRLCRPFRTICPLHIPVTTSKFIEYLGKPPLTGRFEPCPDYPAEVIVLLVRRSLAIGVDELAPDKSSARWLVWDGVAA